MFGGNSTMPFTMPVEPAYGGGNNSNGWGGDGWWVLIILFALFGGWGNGGFGNGGGSGTQGAITRSDLCSEFSFNDLQNGVRNINDSVNVGFSNLNSTICHQQYDTAMLINGVTGAVNNGFSSLNSTICQQQYDTANMMNQMNIANMQNANALQNQLANCCCENRAGQLAIQNQIIQQTCALENSMNTNTRDIIDNQNAGTRAILDYLCQEKISDLQNENQSLKLAASQQAQNVLLTNAMTAQTNQIIDRIAPYPVPAFPVANPYASYGYAGYGYNNSCGCGCGCGCGNGFVA